MLDIILLLLKGRKLYASFHSPYYSGGQILFIHVALYANSEIKHQINCIFYTGFSCPREDNAELLRDQGLKEGRRFGR